MFLNSDYFQESEENGFQDDMIVYFIQEFKKIFSRKYNLLSLQTSKQINVYPQCLRKMQHQFTRIYHLEFSLCHFEPSSEKVS